MHFPLRALGPDTDRATSLLAILWTPFPLTVALICARLFVRLKSKILGLDDHAMVLAWMLQTVALSLSTIYIKHGGTRHLFFVKPEDIVLLLRYNAMSQPFGALASAVGKSSIGFLMLRIMGPQTVWQKRVIYSQLAVYMIITILDIILIFAQCSPPRALWEKVPDSKCWNPVVSTDITILQSGQALRTPVASSLEEQNGQRLKFHQHMAHS
ncbi:MAG: hypothetical protein Q9218_006091 [Villophora microphyllina]